jgi:hypothetical protein
VHPRYFRATLPHDIPQQRTERGCLRVETVFSEAINLVLDGHVGEGVVGPVQDGVLAEHGHDGRRTDSCGLGGNENREVFIECRWLGS